jgi:DNA invertase Pin-like site-specific DNA recombinase
MIIGYARTSSKHQEAGLEDQIEQLRKIGCEKIFSEQVSSVTQRDELDKALDFAREGDTFVVTKLDRLARSVANFLEIQKSLAEKSVSLRILDLNLDTSTPMGEMVLGVLAYVAQFERKIMLERQRVGIAKAKSEGKYKGKPKNEKLLKRMDAEIAAYNRNDPRSLTIKQIAEKLSISQGYLYQRMKKVAPEKIRHRTSKRDIIENVFDGDEKLYAASRLLEKKKRKYAKSVKNGRG